MHVGRVDGTFVLEVRNDGARERARAARAWACGWRRWRRSSAAALVEFGPETDGDWRVRLVVPVGEDAA